MAFVLSVPPAHAGPAENLRIASGSGAAAATCKSKREERAVLHLLKRAAFGPTSELIDRVCQMGRAAWIEEQLRPDEIADPALAARLAIYTALEMSTAVLLATYPEPEPGAPRDPLTSPGRVLGELNAALLTRAVHGQAQLQEVLVDFWANHFSVYAADGPTRWTIMAYLEDAIRPHVLGRFEDLLRATAESPAMLYYLDNYVNIARGSGGALTGINENYARELMELHTLGVDGGYTQEDVIAAARVLTGWTMTRPRNTGTVEFVFRPDFHDDEEKTFRGSTIEAGGVEQGLELLHSLGTDPSTARFIATKLVRRLVNDEPPAEIVDQASDSFQQTGGDIAAVVRTILTHNKFDHRSALKAKVKSPFEFVASALRAVDAQVVIGVAASRLVGELGQPLLRASPPTGWPDVAAGVVSSGGMLSRFEAGYRIAAGLIEGVNVDVSQWETIEAGLGKRGADRIFSAVLHEKARGKSKRALRRASKDGADPLTLAAFALASPEFHQQ